MFRIYLISLFTLLFQSSDAQHIITKDGVCYDCFGEVYNEVAFKEVYVINSKDFKIYESCGTQSCRQEILEKYVNFSKRVDQSRKSSDCIYFKLGDHSYYEEANLAMRYWINEMVLKIEHF